MNCVYELLRLKIMIFRSKKQAELLFKLNRLSKLFSTSTQNHFKVAVVGAAGGIGQPLGLLLKQNPLISQLALYDVSAQVPGIAVDLSHINTRTYTEGFKGDEQLFCSLIGSHIVIITAGLPRKPGMSRDDLFNSNAQIIFHLMCRVARYSPSAIIAIVTNPVNATVPIASEIMMKSGVYDPRKIFGVTTLDLVRAATFVSQLNCSNPACQYVPVVGGHADTTIIPLLSQSLPPVFLSDTIRDNLTKRIQEAGTEVVKAKGGSGSATLSTAFATARFADSILRGLSGEAHVVECSYVRSNITNAQYFATPLVFGRYGLEKNLGYGKVSPYEKDLIDKAIPLLQKSIKKGIDFVEKQFSAK